MLDDAMRRQWLWNLVFHIRRMKGVGASRLRSIPKFR